MYDTLEDVNFNDLWTFDGSNWTWISGSNQTNENGTYGTRWIPNPHNIPGARWGSVGWITSDHSLWLFGGYGFDDAGEQVFLNDLWRFKNSNWTWIFGSSNSTENGIYGTKGIGSNLTVPGGRWGSVGWIDRSNDLWLFGGNVDDFLYESFNDLWKFDGSNWTWISGSNETKQSGIYGSKGVPSSSNIPGARWGSVSWLDSNGDFLLFGGFGFDAFGSKGDLNDLWKFDGYNWTWISGSNETDQIGFFGTQGVPSSKNIPGARDTSIGWIDQYDNLWLFGGETYAHGASFNDLWKYDGSNWTWIAGSNESDIGGIYGTKGMASASNSPGCRWGSVGWIDFNNSLWLFGGYGYDAENIDGDMNDLWKYELHCGIGYFSPDGFVPCIPCPSGTYANRTGMNVCIPCPYNMSSNQGSSVCIPTTGTFTGSSVSSTSDSTTITTTTTNNNNDNNNNDDRTSSREHMLSEVAGAVIGCAVLLVILFGILLLVFLRRRKMANFNRLQHRTTTIDEQSMELHG